RDLRAKPASFFDKVLKAHALEESRGLARLDGDLDLVHPVESRARMRGRMPAPTRARTPGRTRARMPGRMRAPTRARMPGRTRARWTPGRRIR
ncbi:hypothetical protein, partial [Corallococcus exercitus]